MGIMVSNATCGTCDAFDMFFLSAHCGSAEASGGEQCQSSTPACLLDTVRFKLLRPDDVQQLLYHKSFNAWRDQDFLKRIVKHCLEEWSALASD